MLNSSSDNYSKTISRLLEDLFVIDALYHSGDKLNLSLHFKYDKKQSTKILEDRLKLAGYKYSMNQIDDKLLLQIDPKATFRIPLINIVLFFLTLGSVYFVPVYFKENINLENTLNALSNGDGIEFTIAMISILFIHEMGHYIASRRRDIITSWPYFIPAPNIIGTFGAVIKSKSPFWNRRDLIEVGAWGPIAGWIVAVGWLWYGLTQSVIVPENELQGLFGFSLDGESIFMKISTLSILGKAPEGHFYQFTEAAFAGWVGLLVTSINMLPIGQLDGGHVLYGLFRKKQMPFGLTAMGLLLILGYTSPMWWFFALFGIIFGVKHPPTLNDSKEPGRNAKILGIIAVIILIISFTPVPFRY
jgi:membrane-associated protease RseP (regulator of RpoE activity)